LHFIGSLAARWRVKWRGTSQQEIAMLKKLAVLAAGLALSAPVLADRGGRHERHDGYRHHHYKHFHGHHQRARPIVVVPPPRVYYAPAPAYHYAPPPRVYYAPPPPVYYAPPPPVYYAPPPVHYGPPVPHNGISIRLHFPL
jgi:hypothetical protein